MKLFAKTIAPRMAWIQQNFVCITGMLFVVLVNSQDVPEFVPPEACIRKGYCELEDTPDYPHEIAKQIIEEHGIKGVKEDLPDSSISRRAGRPKQSVKLCPSVEKVVPLTAGVTKKNKWVWVINDNFQYNSVQRFRVDVCDYNRTCTSIGIAQVREYWHTTCEQKFVYKEIHVLNPKIKHSKELVKLPSCCTCKAYADL